MADERAEHLARIQAAVRERAAWPSDGSTELAMLLRDGIVAYGISCNASTITDLSALYEHCRQALTDTARLEVFRAVQDALMQDYTSTNALFPFIFSEPVGGIVASATLDYAMRQPVSEGDSLAGVRIIAEWIRDANPANRAAIFAGVLNSGDRRAIELLVDLRTRLSVDQINEVASLTTGFPTIGAFEFWLQWLEDAIEAGLGSTNLFSAASSALVYLVRRAQVSEFADVVRDFGYRPGLGEPGVRFLERLTVSDLAGRYRQRLYALEAAEPPPKVMSATLTFYGLEPKAAAHERAWLQ